MNKPGVAPADEGYENLTSSIIFIQDPKEQDVTDYLVRRINRMKRIVHLKMKYRIYGYRKG
jgi:hypothetical protein